MNLKKKYTALITEIDKVLSTLREAWLSAQEAEKNFRKSAKSADNDKAEAQLLDFAEKEAEKVKTIYAQINENLDKRLELMSKREEKEAEV